LLNPCRDSGFIPASGSSARRISQRAMRHKLKQRGGVFDFFIRHGFAEQSMFANQRAA